jgi:hypothetical protein
MKTSSLKNHKKYNKNFFDAVKECVTKNEDVAKFGFLFEEKKNVSKVINSIRKGADINAIDENGNNALLIVLKGEEPIRTDVLKVLLFEENIEIQEKLDTRKQKTILERAAEIENHHDALLICKRLVKKGAVIQDKEKGINAIFFADEACNDKLVNFFEDKLLEQAAIIGNNAFLEQQLLGQD